MARPRRSRLRPPRGGREQAAAAAVACAVLWLLAKIAVTTWHATVRVWPLLALFAIVGLGYAAWRLVRAVRARRVRAQMLARLRITLAQFDVMDDQAFEFALRDLLIRDGWRARQVGRQGDQAADVIGEDRRRGRIVVQAKHTTVAGKVGSSVMYQVKGTAGPVHGADIAVVVTNGSFTRDAKAWGERHQVYWVDRDRLRRWAEYGTPLQDLLRLPSRPAPRTAFRRAA
ncbi:restriction endonuclease [Streptomyces yerevanensis]|uniref:restriction endonuclease n=1 Tax=Streptomyces yerevanensis TaxID=66378 RepID=UPI000525C906|nr:restriction endonuclease [Streptomyces yerevanensis]